MQEISLLRTQLQSSSALNSLTQKQYVQIVPDGDALRSRDAWRTKNIRLRALPEAKTLGLFVYMGKKKTLRSRLSKK